MSPYQQGELDGLCGLYALINASRLAVPTLEKKECQDIFRTALDWLGRNYKGFPPMVCDGLTFEKLRSLHKRVFQMRWPTISLHQPFLRNMPQRPSEFWTRMEEEAEREGQGMFIGIGRGMDHWSAVRKITSKRIILFDSDKRKFLSRSHCGFLERHNKKYIVGPGYVLLLRANE